MGFDFSLTNDRPRYKIPPFVFLSTFFLDVSPTLFRHYSYDLILLLILYFLFVFSIFSWGGQRRDNKGVKGGFSLTPMAERPCDPTRPAHRHLLRILRECDAPYLLPMVHTPNKNTTKKVQNDGLSRTLDFGRPVK